MANSLSKMILVTPAVFNGLLHNSQDHPKLKLVKKPVPKSKQVRKPEKKLEQQWNTMKQQFGLLPEQNHEPNRRVHRTFPEKPKTVSKQFQDVSTQYENLNVNDAAVQTESNTDHVAKQHNDEYLYDDQYFYDDDYMDHEQNHELIVDNDEHNMDYHEQVESQDKLDPKVPVRGVKRSKKDEIEDFLFTNPDEKRRKRADDLVTEVPSKGIKRTRKDDIEDLLFTNPDKKRKRRHDLVLKVPERGVKRVRKDDLENLLFTYPNEKRRKNTKIDPVKRGLKRKQVMNPKGHEHKKIKLQGLKRKQQKYPSGHESKKIKLHSKRGLKRKQLKYPSGHQTKKFKWEMLR